MSVDSKPGHVIGSRAHPLEAREGNDQVDAVPPQDSDWADDALDDSDWGPGDDDSGTDALDDADWDAANPAGGDWADDAFTDADWDAAVLARAASAAAASGQAGGEGSVCGFRPRFTPDQVAAALLSSGGSRSAAAQALGCHPLTVWRYIKRYPTVRAAGEQALHSRRQAGERLPVSGRWHYTPDQVAAALHETGGNRRQAARLLGCSPETIARYRARFPIVAEACSQQSPDASPRPRPRRSRYTPEQVAEAVLQAHGVEVEAARLLHCHRTTITRYRDRYPVVQHAYEQAWRERGRVSGWRDGRHPSHLTPAQVAGALLQARGIKAVAARLLRCSYSTLTLYLDIYPEVRRAREEARATLVDHVQSQLVKKVEAGQWQAVVYVLSHYGKERGYTRHLGPRPTSAPLDVPPRYRRMLLETEARLKAEKAAHDDGEQ